MTFYPKITVNNNIKIKSKNCLKLFQGGTFQTKRTFQFKMYSFISRIVPQTWMNARGNLKKRTARPKLNAKRNAFTPHPNAGLKLFQDGSEVQL